jgi:nondiscriminating glutamyl-tRNA synthetase
VSVREYKEEGFLPEALANYLILLGWTPPGGAEILDLPEAARQFGIQDMNDVQAKFDIQKLKWMNGEYIMKAPTLRLLPLLRDQLARDGFDSMRVDDGRLAAIVDAYKIRIKTLREFGPMTDFFFRDDFIVDEEARAKYLGPAESRDNLAEFARRLEPLPAFTHEAIEAVCRSLAEERSLKAAGIIHPTRIAVSGKSKGAGLFEIMEMLGRDVTLARMKGAVS